MVGVIKPVLFFALRLRCDQNGLRSTQDELQPKVGASAQKKGLNQHGAKVFSLYRQASGPGITPAQMGGVVTAVQNFAMPVYAVLA